MSRALPFVLVALAVAVAAIAANVLLLGYANGAGDPVGNLSPVQPALTAPGPTTTAPAAQAKRRSDDD